MYTFFNILTWFLILAGAIAITLVIWFIVWTMGGKQ
jgi:hypothetical protein